jgi:superfamily II DNA/RNA helicase
MPFSHLIKEPKLLKSIANLGFVKPTSIQNQAIPVILSGQDLRASAQTGTGKTAAFILPILSLLMKSHAGHGPRVLILVPTRELAEQILSETKKHSQDFPFIKTICLFGGVPYPQQNRDLSSKYDILVATPGRLIDHMERGKISFSRLQILVLDEADRMLDMGFIKPVEQIAAKTPPHRQTLLFSATLKGSVINLSKKLLKNPVDINISPESVTCKNIEQKFFHADNQQHKKSSLIEFLKDPSLDQAIIFTATKRQAARLAKELQEEGYLASALHGDMSQHQRTKTMQKMRQKKFNILVATDVAARGLDVLTITHVINYDLPNNSEDYVHRIGRTGRAGAKGLAISLVSHKDRPVLKDIELLLKERITFVNKPQKNSEQPPMQQTKPQKNNFHHQNFHKQRRPKKRRFL